MESNYVLTDNFKGNMILLPLTVSLYLLIIKSFGKLPYLGLYPGVWGLVAFILQFSFCYIFASRFYSPDLDHRETRPGKAHFPLGKQVIFLMFDIEKGLSKKSGSARILNILFKLPITVILKTQRVLAFTWYWLWHPLSRVVTHRGCIHWPIFGVLMRNTYLLGILYLLSKILGPLHIQFIDKALASATNFLQMFFKPTWSRDFILICVPVFLSDINHSAVDMYDSYQQEYSFCPPKIQRGLIAKTFNSITRKKI